MVDACAGPDCGCDRWRRLGKLRLHRIPSPAAILAPSPVTSRMRPPPRHLAILAPLGPSFLDHRGRSLAFLEVAGGASI